MKKSTTKLKKTVAIAIFTAIAYISLYVLPIKGIGGFLTFDIKDAIIAVAAMIFGPVAGVIIAFTVSLIEMVTISGTGPLGMLMNFAGSAVFCAVGSLVYRYMPKLKHTLSGAIVGLSCATVSMTGIMIILNLIITPIYQNVPVEVVKEMIIPLLLPFNMIKGIANSVLVMILYRPLSVALNKAKVINTSNRSFSYNRRSVIITVICSLLMAACVALMIVTFEGQLKLF